MQRTRGVGLQRLACVALALVAILLSAGVVRAEPPYLSHGGPVAIAGGGAVWFDEAPILFQPFTGAGARIGWGVRYRQPFLQSAGRSVAGLTGEGRFLGGVPPGPLRPIDPPEWATPQGDCSGGWAPNSGEDPDFVVVGTKLISQAACLSGEAPALEPESEAHQPLFIHDVRGGRWRVWRWISSEFAPVLAAEGGLVAVGELLRLPAGAKEGTRRMRVSVIDLRTGRTEARSVMPAGQLAFAAPDRLVLTRESQGSPPRAAAVLERPILRKIVHHSWLYSTGGRRIADLGTEVLAVSHMHMLVEETAAYGEGSAVSVWTIPRRRPTQVVGFDSPRRVWVGLAFRWPALALVERTATPLPASQATCATGYYSQLSAPSLQIIDLARPHAYEPPPPPSPLEVAKVRLPGRCPVIPYG